MKITRQTLLTTVADNMLAAESDDLPAIRQAINDTADMFRKSGGTCPDFAQDGMVRDVQRRLKARSAAYFGHIREGMHH